MLAMRYLLGLSLVVACGGSDPAVDAQADGAPDAPVDAVAVDGPISDGPIRDGPIRDGPTRDGPTRDGPTRDGPISDVRRLSMMSGLLMPTSTAQATLFGFDLDGRANDGVDNQLGTLLASFTNIAPELSIPEAVTTAVDRGRVLSLVELRADDLVDDPAAVVRVHVGEQPDPPACSSAADVVCRRHFGGDATVELATGVMPGAPLAGQLVSGTLTLSVADGELTLPFALGDRPAGRRPGRARLRHDRRRRPLRLRCGDRGRHRHGLLRCRRRLCRRGRRGAGKAGRAHLARPRSRRRWRKRRAVDRARRHRRRRSARSSAGLARPRARGIRRA